MGVDREQLRPISRLQRRSLRGLLAAVVRHPQGAEGRELRHAAAAGESELQKLLYQRPRRRLRRFSHVQKGPMNAPEKIRLTEFSHGGGCGWQIRPALLSQLLGKREIPGF